MHGAHAHVTHGQPLQSINVTLFSQYSVQVGQDLGGMFTPAITAIDDGHRSPPGCLHGSTLLEMAHHDDITVVFQHFDRVFDRFLVPVTSAGHFGIRKTRHMTAQAVHGGFMSKAGTGAGLIKSGYHGFFSQQITVTTAFGDRRHFVRHFKHMEKFFSFEILQRKNISTSKTTHSRSS
jgi:hypothetical protein